MIFLSFRRRNFKWNQISLINPIYLQRLYEVPVPWAKEDSSIQLKELLSSFFLMAAVLLFHIGSTSFFCIYSCRAFLTLFCTHRDMHTYPVPLKKPASQAPLLHHSTSAAPVCTMGLNSDICFCLGRRSLLFHKAD